METDPSTTNWDALMAMARHCRDTQISWARRWAETIQTPKGRKYSASARRVRMHAKRARGWNRALVGIKRERTRELGAAAIVARTQEVVHETVSSDYEFCQLSDFAGDFAWV